ILAAVCALGIQAYLRTSMAGMLREGAEGSESRLFWCGVFTQLGSFVGAVLIFPLVSVYHLFQSAPQCR
uniref:Riboflavin transporter n=1 Tax=Plectus sambesii TaxID=2011161 RepID=A0A914WPZ1_9BILA